MSDLIELWDLKMVKEKDTINIRYSPVDFLVDYDLKHGCITLQKRKGDE